MLPTKSDGRIHPNWPYMPIQMQLYVGHQLTNRCSFFFGCWWITIRQPADTRQSLSYLLILTCQSFNVIRVVHILCISYTFLRSRLIEHTKHLHLNKSRSFIFINLFVTHWTLFVVEYICLVSFSYDIVFFVVIVLKVEHIFICFVFTKSICCGHLTVFLSPSLLIYSLSINGVDYHCVPNAKVRAWRYLRSDYRAIPSLFYSWLLLWFYIWTKSPVPLIYTMCLNNRFFLSLQST